VSGSASFPFRTAPGSDAEIRRVIEADENTTYLVDDLMPADVSPNVLVDVPLDGGPPVLVGTSDQILTDTFVHQGNLAPSRATRIQEMARDAVRLAQWLQTQGYSGPAGFDFIEWEDDGARRYALCELNPRVNGATYPLALLERFRPLGCRACLSVNLRTRAGNFEQLRPELGALMLQPGHTSGLLPYNTGCLAVGKFTGAFLAPSHEEAEAMLAAFRRDHPAS
jgi:hypothetical protein